MLKIKDMIAQGNFLDIHEITSPQYFNEKRMGQDRRICSLIAQSKGLLVISGCIPLLRPGYAGRGNLPNAERQMPNAERRTPNAERRTPNAERRTPNAERLSV